MNGNYLEKIIELLRLFDKEEEEVLKKASSLIVDSIGNGGRFWLFGTGHSHMVGEEFYARSGGLAFPRLIAPMELTLGSHPLKSTAIERIADYADVVILEYGICKGDVVLLSSNSGRNSLVVELALRLKELGAATIAFTSLEHSRSSESRHCSGKRLYEVCDLVIDNHGRKGDAFFEIEAVKGRMGASSSIIGMYMAQKLSMMIASLMAERGMEVPVFLSANVDGGDKWNDSLMKKYLI